MRINQILQPKKILLEDCRRAAEIVSKVLLELKELTKPEVSLNMLDEIAARRIKEYGAESINLNYKPDWAQTPFPATVCMSVDYEICHGTPRGRFLKEGEIIKYDLGVRYKSGCGDAALTVPVGEISNRKERTIRYCLRALYAGIRQVKAGVPIARVSEAVEHEATKHGYQVIREFGGHHIGREMHEDPAVPNRYYKEDEDRLLEEGRIICIEPMITPGKGGMKMAKEDGWTAFCPDGQPVAMFEHMILVAAEGYEVLTTHLEEPNVV